MRNHLVNFIDNRGYLAIFDASQWLAQVRIQRFVCLVSIFYYCLAQFDKAGTALII